MSLLLSSCSYLWSMLPICQGMSTEPPSRTMARSDYFRIAVLVQLNVANDARQTCSCALFRTHLTACVRIASGTCLDRGVGQLDAASYAAHPSCRWTITSPNNRPLFSLLGGSYS